METPFKQVLARSSGRREGFALAAVIIVLVVVLVLGFGYLSIGFHEVTLATKEGHNARAFFLAEAGRHRAMYDLSMDWDNLPSYSDVELGGGTYSINASRDAGDNVTINATGSVRGMARSVSQVVQRH